MSIRKGLVGLLFISVLGAGCGHVVHHSARFDEQTHFYSRLEPANRGPRPTREYPFERSYPIPICDFPEDHYRAGPANQGPRAPRPMLRYTQPGDVGYLPNQHYNREHGTLVRRGTEIRYKNGRREERRIYEVQPGDWR